MQTSVHQIHVSSRPDSTYFLRVDWRGRGLASGFQLLLTDGREAWRGEVSAAAVSSEAEELEMQLERYVQDLQGALTGGGHDSAYSFTLTARSSGVTLAYEKVQKDISFRLGSVPLDPVRDPSDAVRRLLVHSLKTSTTLKNQNQNLEQENQRLRREQQRITAQLQRYVGGKESLEAELYSRFVVVLNEKKAKIRRLQENSSVTQKDEGQEEEEDEYGGSTDEEQQQQQQQQEEEEEEEEATSTSTTQRRDASTPDPLDDSLRDITDVAPSRKRRVRHLVAPAPAPHLGKKTTPATSQRRPDSPAGSRIRRQHQPPSSADDDDLFADF